MPVGAIQVCLSWQELSIKSPTDFVKIELNICGSRERISAILPFKRPDTYSVPIVLPLKRTAVINGKSREGPKGLFCKIPIEAISKISASIFWFDSVMKNQQIPVTCFDEVTDNADYILKVVAHPQEKFSATFSKIPPIKLYFKWSGASSYLDQKIVSIRLMTLGGGLQAIACIPQEKTAEKRELSLSHRIFDRGVYRSGLELPRVLVCSSQIANIRICALFETNGVQTERTIPWKYDQLASALGEEGDYAFEVSSSPTLALVAAIKAYSPPSSPIHPFYLELLAILNRETPHISTPKNRSSFT